MINKILKQNVGLNHEHQTNLNLQNLAACLINCVRRPILQAVHWLLIKMSVTFKICTNMYKILHDLSAVRLPQLCLPTRVYSCNCDRQMTLAVKMPRTVGRSSFAVTGPAMWNSVRCEIIWDIGSFPKTTKNSPISLPLPALVTLISILRHCLVLNCSVWECIFTP